ncbi:LysM peptidoglycan-binding domain-containing protein [Streptomyces sp. AJS327]|uniref:LysM peptidoglycan-binding domain-containing protein n=1 Tax=Streptomyces sp. AJS327 TaxID=2545265 RepID=UPI0015DEAA3D|nr:transglycosylase family protein [Streptomyces sp. AJS327]MBA0049714.1 LysM peptidoglycan-binding domain-containing protein [Streptomyces sp. AJS327]
MRFSGKGRHRRPSIATRAVAVTGVAGAAVALPLMTAGSAQAASVETWEKVAQCESTGNWSINTGNGYYGGLQFSSSSWAAAGGTQYAPNAHQATKAQQIATAERLLAIQGPGAWACASAGGLTAGGPAANVNPDGASAERAQPQERSNRQAQPKPQQTQPQQAQPQKSQPKPAQPKAGKGNHVVKSGETLSKIADAKGTTWKKIYQDNKSTVGGDPNLIFPGQKLQVR